jgi:hypothetical protein
MIRDIAGAVYLTSILLVGAVLETAHEVFGTKDSVLFDREVLR